MQLYLELFSPLLVGSRLMSFNIVNYLTFLTCKIQLDSLDSILLGIILFPLSIGFGLICRTWAFLIAKRSAVRNEECRGLRGDLHQQIPLVAKKDEVIGRLRDQASAQ